MSAAHNVGAQVSAAWSRHAALPRWRYLPGPDPEFVGTLVLFCSDSMHPIYPDRPGLVQMCYGFARDVIVLGVRRGDRAVLELVPKADGDTERRLSHAAMNAPDSVLGALLAAGRWRLADTWRGFLLSWFSHGFGMTTLQHAHVFRVLLDLVDERALPQPREAIEADLNRREVRVMRKARRRLFELLNRPAIHAVRRSNAIVTPATYNLIATAPSEAARHRRLAALKAYPAVLPAFIAKDPPFPGRADVLAYYESGGERSFRALAKFIVSAVDRAEPLAPFFSRPIDCPIDVIGTVRDVPRLALWRMDGWSMQALLRTVDAMPRSGRPKTLSDWMAFREIAVAVNALAEAFGDASQDAAALFWNGSVMRFLEWSAGQGWTIAVEAVRDPSGTGLRVYGIEQSLAAAQDVARAQGAAAETALEELARLSLPEVIAWNGGWQDRIDAYRRRVEKKAATSDE